MNCCNHNCNQGRDCPLRKANPAEEWMKEHAPMTYQAYLTWRVENERHLD